MSIRSCLVSILCVALAGSAVAGDYRVGLSNVDMTPDFEIRSMRYPAIAHTEAGIYPGDGMDLGLSVRAVYIAKLDGSEPVVLVAADLINLCPMDSDDARDPDHYNIPNLTRERVLINITHTHTTPTTCDTSVRTLDYDGRPLMEDADPAGPWRTRVRAKFVEAIQQAYNNAQVASLKFYRSKFDAGLNRRTGIAADLTDTTGTVIANLGGYDRTLDAVEIVGYNGGRTGVLFFYGMHPVVLGNSLFPTTPSSCDDSTGKWYHHPDYPGFARKIIEDGTPQNDIAIFFQAAGGDVVPTSCCGYCVAKTVGQNLGNRVLDMITPGGEANAIEGEILPSQGGNSVFNRMWSAPFQTAAGIHRLGGTSREPRGIASAAPGSGQFSSAFWSLWATHYCEGFTGHGGGNPPCSLNPGVIADTSWDVELQTLTVGNWRVAGLSHEPVSQHGVRLRQRWLDDWVSFAGYIQREQNYLPTSGQLTQDDHCLAYGGPSCTAGVGYEGFVAQLWNGNPAPWATYETTATSTTGSSYDLDAEIAHVLKAETPLRVNYANRWHGTTATASSEMGGRPAIAAINGDRKGIHWGTDGTTGSGWHDDTINQYADWIEIDFHAPRTIDQIDVFTPQNRVDIDPPVEPTGTMTCDDYGILDFEVQVLDSTRWPAVWVTVKNGLVTGNDKVWRKFPFAPRTTTKIRVLVTHSRLGYSRIVEIEGWGNATSRPNVALTSKGATAAASSTLDDGRLPIAAINGDRKGIHWGSDPPTGSGWHDASASNFSNDWLEITFAGSRTINQVNVFSVQDDVPNPVEPTETLTFTLYGLIDFQLEYWDGAHWVLVPGGSVTGNNLVWRKFIFPPLTTTKLRLEITNGGTFYTRVVELEALTPYDFLSSVPP